MGKLNVLGRRRLNGTKTAIIGKPARHHDSPEAKKNINISSQVQGSSSSAVAVPTKRYTVNLEVTYNMSSPQITATTQAVGITASLILSGFYFSTSSVSIQPLLGLPINESTRIFSSIYHSGLPIAVALSVSAALSNATSAYLVPSSVVEYGIATASTLAPLFLTQAIMMPGIQRLLKVSKMDGSEIQGVRKAEVVDLLLAWRSQNFARGAFCFVAGVVAMYACIKGRGML